MEIWNTNSKYIGSGYQRAHMWWAIKNQFSDWQVVVFYSHTKTEQLSQTIYVHNNLNSSSFFKYHLLHGIWHLFQFFNLFHQRKKDFRQSNIAFFINRLFVFKKTAPGATTSRVKIWMRDKIKQHVTSNLSK